MADAMNLHGLPPPAASRRDAATIKSLGRKRVPRGGRSRKWLLARLQRARPPLAAWPQRYADIAKLLAVRVVDCERGFRAGTEPIALELDNGAKDVDDECVVGWIVAADKI